MKQGANNPEDMEARLTALICGELDQSEERKLLIELERAPELAAQYKRLKTAAGLVREAVKADSLSGAAPLQLSREKRGQLLASFKTAPERQNVRPVVFGDRVREWLLPLAAAAAVLVFLALLLAPDSSRSRVTVGRVALQTTGEATASSAPTHQADSAMEPLGLKLPAPAFKGTPGHGAFARRTPFSAEEPKEGPQEGAKITDKFYDYSPRGEAQPSGGVAGGAVVSRDYFRESPASTVTEPLDSGVLATTEQPLTRGLNDLPKTEAPSLAVTAAGTDNNVRLSESENLWAAVTESTKDAEQNDRTFGRFYSPLTESKESGGPTAARDALGAIAQNEKMSKEKSVLFGESQLDRTPAPGVPAPSAGRALRFADAREPAARAEARQLARTDQDEAGHRLGFVLREKLVEQKAAEVRLSRAAPQFSPESVTSENPYSTFSLNVSDVSFKLASASLEKGALPEPSSIRAEEFLNAFDFRDPEPSKGAPLAFTWEQAKYPFNYNRDVLRLSIKTGSQGRQAGKPVNLVLLLDNSGSMERADRVRITREMLGLLGGQLKENDRISVVTFSRRPTLRVDGRPGSEAKAVLSEVADLTPEGGTNLEEGLEAAYETAARHHLPDGANRVVLFTDGAANLGDINGERLKGMVEAQRKRGIALDAFGIGWEGLNDPLLEELTRNGDGRYAFLNSPQEAETEFVNRLLGALRVTAADVKVQVQFNPSRVNRYRQVGYNKHQLTKEQFRDNSVDAAEIGAAEAGNALYLLEVNPNGNGPVGVARARYKDPETGLYHEREWPIPYNGTSVNLEQSSSAMRLATCAGAFSEALEQNPHAAEVTSDKLLSLLQGVPEYLYPDPRPKKLEWMIRQAKSLGLK